MENLFLFIKTSSDYLANTYNVNLSIFFIIYLISFLPFYFGYFLIIYGSTRKLKLEHIFTFELKNNLRWTNQAKVGLYIHLFGRVMPYVYILFFGRNIPFWAYLTLAIIVVFPVYFFLNKLFFRNKNSLPEDIEILRKDIYDDDVDSDVAWEIYNHTFERINAISPCRQSFDEVHFREVLKDSSVRKYFIIKDGEGIIGLGLITNNFKNTPWISEDYFKVNFSIQHSKNLIYYFMGLAIHDDFRGNKYSIRLIEHIIDDLPHGAIMGFDHSKNINPMLHHFTRLVKQASTIKRSHIDRQHYHVVQRK